MGAEILKMFGGVINSNWEDWGGGPGNFPRDGGFRLGKWVEKI